MTDSAGSATSHHILHLSTETVRRGGERQVSLLHRGLQEAGWRSSIACRDARVFADDRDTQELTWNGLADVPGFLRARTTVQSLQPDILHCHDARAFTLGSFLGSATKKPVVLTRRVLFPIRKHPLNRWKYARVAHGIGISQAVVDALHGVAGERPISRVADAVEGTPVTDKERQVARQQLALNDDTLVIGSVGHFTEEKNAALLLDLADHLATTRDNIMLVAMGPLDTTLGPRAREQANVLATGFVSDPLALYAAFDLYVSTSRSEGLGSALLDAVVRDIPALAVDAGGVRDIFGDRPRLASPGDSYDFFRLVDLGLDDLEGLRADSRELGREARERFHPQVMVQGNLEVYQQVLATTAAGVKA